MTVTIPYKYGKTLWQVQREYILQVLTANRGNRTATACELNINLRTLRNHLLAMKEEGIDVPKPEYIRIKGTKPITVDTY
jgi:DNA-binding NtrC family response regulator